MKDVLIITNYFPPEMGAASNRIFHLAEGLKADYNVSVLCPLPNYPTGTIFENYKNKFTITENLKGIKIKRLWIYASISKNKFVRLFSMLSYSFSLMWYFLWYKIPKTVIIQSPPLLVAFTSLFFLQSKKHKLILNVSDLWPSAGLELGALKKGVGYKLLKKIERFNYKKAHVILGQSEEIIAHTKTITSKPKTFLYRNYPNFEAQELLDSDTADAKKIKLVYAGLLGVAQGVLKLCKNLDYTNYEFHIYGTGAEEKEIIYYINKNPKLPIVFHGSVSRTELHQQLVNYDLTIIPLLNRIYGSVPSKIFEYARIGLPIIYFGGGEGESIIKEYYLGWVVSAENYQLLNSTLSQITKEELNASLRIKIQKSAEVNFDFKSQLENLKAYL